MLRIGCIILTLWTVLNLVPSSWILISTVFLDGDSPAVFQILDENDLAGLTAKERTSINSVAVYANGLNAAFGVTSLFVIWKGLYRRQTWCFWCLVIGFGTALLAGVLGDFVLGTIHPEINIVSGAMLIAGLALSAAELLGRNRQPLAS